MFDKPNQPPSTTEKTISKHEPSNLATSVHQVQPLQRIITQPQRKKFRFHDPPEVHSRPRAHKKRPNASDLVDLKRKKQQTTKKRNHRLYSRRQFDSR